MFTYALLACQLRVAQPIFLHAILKNCYELHHAFFCQTYLILQTLNIKQLLHLFKYLNYFFAILLGYFFLTLCSLGFDEKHIVLAAIVFFIKTSVYVASFHLALLNIFALSKYGVFSGPYFSVFGQNTGTYRVNLQIQCKYGKTRPEEAPYLETFHVVVTEPTFINNHDQKPETFQIFPINSLYLTVSQAND